MAVFDVTNLNDSGSGSLRQAIADANNQPGLDEINFVDSLSGGQITLTSGELEITDSLNINGLGRDNLTISGNNNSRVFFVGEEDDFAFEDSINSIDVAIDSVTISDGVADFSGGGVFLNSSRLFRGEENSLQITNSKIVNNQKGGISSQYSSLELDNTIITNNQGGGLYSYASSFSIENSTISNNQASGNVFRAGNGKIINSTIADNNGSGIFNTFTSDLELVNSTVSGNSGAGIGNGGNLEGGGKVKVIDSSISNNGTGIRDSGRGTKTVVQNSVISNNTASGTYTERYANLEVYSSVISGNGSGVSIRGIENSTRLVNVSIYGNTSDGIWVFPYDSARLEVVNSTITGNSARGGAGVAKTNFYEADFSDAGRDNVVFANTIIAGNEGDRDVLGGFRSKGNNLIGNGDNSVGFDADSDLVGTATDVIDPLLSPLQDNGGKTPTTQLLPGSPAIDRGDNNLIFDNITTDQRGEGFPRIIDGDNDGTATVDIGAFEASFGNNTPPNSEIKGTNGNDNLFGTDADDTIRGLKGHDTLDGGVGNDILKGNLGNDNLVGGDGDDLLKGNKGQDILDGGIGDDTLYGGQGEDSFVLRIGEGTDRIMDYERGVDRLVFGNNLESTDLEFTRNKNILEVKYIPGNEVIASINLVKG